VTVAKHLVSQVYGWVFRLLIALIPEVDELDVMLGILDGESDDRLL
jgi:hypothetical protein